MEDTKEILTVESIRNCVYIIRGQQVMLDSDLASIYGYEVKRLNEQVKRNINRFPEDFMFQLTREEVDLVKSQNATSRNDSLFEGQDGGRRKMPYAFTEQGIYMLATVLKLQLMCFLRMREPGDAMKVPVLRKDEILLMRSSIKMSPGADVIWYTKENVQSEQYFFYCSLDQTTKVAYFWST